MTTLTQAAKTQARVKKHAALMKKLMQDEGMDREEASQKAYKLLIAHARRTITAKIKRR